jgi:hypothetical protein
MEIQPLTSLSILLSDQYKEFEQLQIKSTINFEVHLGTIITKPSRSRDFEPSLKVKKIFYSVNEKYAVLVTENVAVAIRITYDGFQVVGQIRLPAYGDQLSSRSDKSRKKREGLASPGRIGSPSNGLESPKQPKETNRTYESNTSLMSPNALSTL